MSEFKLIDGKQRELPVTNATGRWFHLATVYRGVREYICFTDTVLGKTYIEEVIGGHLEFIEDDALIQSIYEFLKEKKILEITNQN